jgi:hypothetical protein
VLWLATAADSAQVAANTFVSCSDYFLKSIEGACRQTSGIEAFAFLNWIIREYLLSQCVSSRSEMFPSHGVHGPHSRLIPHCALPAAHRRVEIFRRTGAFLHSQCRPCYPAGDVPARSRSRCLVRPEYSQPRWVRGAADCAQRGRRVAWRNRPSFCSGWDRAPERLD